METINTTERLRTLRKLMKENEIDVYSMYPWSPISFEFPLIVMKLFLQKTAINRNISLLVMPEEVRLFPGPAVFSFGSRE